MDSWISDSGCGGWVFQICAWVLGFRNLVLGSGIFGLETCVGDVEFGTVILDLVGVEAWILNL